MAYKQDFFLALAANGKDAWNAWRRDPANIDVRVTFARIDFSQAPRDRIDFSGFEFGDHSDFSECKWRGVKWEKIQKDPNAFRPGRACFTGAAFGTSAIFIDAAFGSSATFYGAAFRDAAFTRAAFGDWAIFAGTAFGIRTFFTCATFGTAATFLSATFGGVADFSGAAFRDAAFTHAAFGDKAGFADAAFSGHADFFGVAFGDEATFADAAFSGHATFFCVAFGERASFARATFGGVADFRGAAFGAKASFGDTFFKGTVEFTGTPIEQWSRDLEPTVHGTDTEAGEALKKRHKELRTRSGSNRFLAISFANARFDGEVDFSSRTFKDNTDFNHARFCRPPVFEPETIFDRIDFTGAYIGFGPPAVSV